MIISEPSKIFAEPGVARAHVEGLRNTDWWKLTESQWEQIKHEYLPAFLAALRAQPADPVGGAGAEAMREACIEIVHRRGERSRRTIRDLCADLAKEIEALPLPNPSTQAELERPDVT